MYDLVVGNIRVKMPEDGRTLKIGRAAENDIVLNDSRASRRHAEIRFRKGQLEIRDLLSLNGTLLDGRRIVPEFWWKIKPYQLVQVGTHELYFEGPGSERPVEATHNISEAPTGAETLSPEQLSPQQPENRQEAQAGPARATLQEPAAPRPAPRLEPPAPAPPSPPAEAPHLEPPSTPPAPPQSAEMVAPLPPPPPMTEPEPSPLQSSEQPSEAAEPATRPLGEPPESVSAWKKPPQQPESPPALPSFGEPGPRPGLAGGEDSGHETGAGVGGLPSPPSEGASGLFSEGASEGSLTAAELEELQARGSGDPWGQPPASDSWSVSNSSGSAWTKPQVEEDPWSASAGGSWASPGPEQGWSPKASEGVADSLGDVEATAEPPSALLPPIAMPQASEEAPGKPLPLSLNFPKSTPAPELEVPQTEPEPQSDVVENESEPEPEFESDSPAGVEDDAGLDITVLFKTNMLMPDGRLARVDNLPDGRVRVSWAAKAGEEGLVQVGVDARNNPVMGRTKLFTAEEYQQYMDSLWKP